VKNEEIATSALNAVRKIAQSVRSSNKLYPGESVETAEQRRSTYTNRARAEGAQAALPEVAARKLVGQGIANCTDLAWVAIDQIREKTGEWSLVRCGIDHVFIAVGVDFEGIPVPKNLESWKPDTCGLGEIWICDPWADISVAAQHYACAWDSRMHEWENAGMKIGVSGDQRWIPPTKWIGLIKTSNKAQVTSRGEISSILKTTKISASDYLGVPSDAPLQFPSEVPK
jgi:hypothetical protein